MEIRAKKHILVLPFPVGHGHLNPMLHFAKKLVCKGLRVTVVTSICTSISKKLPSSVGSINLDVISDGYDESPFPFHDTSDHEIYFNTLRCVGSKTLAQLIKKYETSSCPFDCIVYESFVPWALDVAKSFNLAAVAFFTTPCSVNYILYNVYTDELKLPITSTPVRIPGLPLLELQDMPGPVSEPGTYVANMKLYMEQFSNLDKVDFVLVNTFNKLEERVVDIMSKKCPMLTIGPTILSICMDQQLENDENIVTDLYANQEESKTDNWLNSKPARSVLYVAFGTVVTLSEKQMEELACCLKRINYNFLWVVRNSEKKKIPKTSFQDLGDKVLVVNWSNQVKVLSHEAIGCFLTHCGWNSTLEALCLGVPMVAMPQWSDEPTIAKLIEDVWKVGIRVKVDYKSGIMKREEIEFCIEEIMEGKTGMEMKANALKWKQLAIEAISKGGTSDMNYKKLAKWMS